MAAKTGTPWIAASGYLQKNLSLSLRSTARILRIFLPPPESKSSAARMEERIGKKFFRKMATELTTKEIAEKYDRFARWFDWVEGVPDLLGVRKLRRRLFRQASGRVLEVAVGTGKNLPYYPVSCRIIAVDVSREMLNVARTRAAKLSVNLFPLLADAEDLPFPDKSFDTGSLFSYHLHVPKSGC